MCLINIFILFIVDICHLNWRYIYDIVNLLTITNRLLLHKRIFFLHRKASVSLPANDLINSLCNSFFKYFKDNITQIHSSFPVYTSSCNIDFPVVHHLFTVFKPALLIEVLSSPNKPCELDLIEHTNCSNY